MKRVLFFLCVMLLSVGTHASTITTTLSGWITGSSVEIGGATYPVSIGDRFSLSFSYNSEPSSQLASPYKQDVFRLISLDGSGSLFNVEQSLFDTSGFAPLLVTTYYPGDTLHHRDWYFGDAQIVTNFSYQGSPLGYGWFNNGKSFLSIDSYSSEVSPVPAPPAAILFLSGLFLFALRGTIKRP